MSPSQQGMWAGNWITVIPALFPRTTSAVLDSVWSVPWYLWGRREGPVSHQPSSPQVSPERLMDPCLRVHWVQDSLLDVSYQRQERSFFWGHLKACVPAVPTSHSLKSGHFQLNTMKRESTSNLSSSSAPLVWKKILSWEDYQPFVAALNSLCLGAP